MKTLREQIQTLVIWWVSATVFSVLLSAIIIIGVFIHVEYSLGTSSSSFELLADVTTIAFGIVSIINKMVIVIWFWSLYQKNKSIALLWAIFGFVGGLLTILIHIGLAIYEKQPVQESISP